MGASAKRRLFCSAARGEDAGSEESRLTSLWYIQDLPRSQRRHAESSRRYCRGRVPSRRAQGRQREFLCSLPRLDSTDDTLLQLLEGNRGLLFTNEEPKVVLEWFADFKKEDFARSGNVIEETFVLPAGLSPSPPSASPSANLAVRGQDPS